jgi:nitrate reductase delta subunit
MAEQRDQPSQPGAGEVEVRRGVLIAAARLLAYPDATLRALLPEIEAYLRGLPASSPVTALATVAGRLREMEVAKLEERYVATFDFNEAAALYLTAHELGDSRRRGQALVELRTLLRASGFEEATEELPDYLPLLLEFLAHVPALEVPAGMVDSIDALERRLAAVCERICTHLDTGNLYRDLFVALRGVLPEPAEVNPERRFAQREQADTGEMPYPLRYD